MKRETKSMQKIEKENPNSMTLAISREDAKRMLEASRSFNTALSRLQREEFEELKASGHGKNGYFDKPCFPDKDINIEGSRVKREDESLTGGSTGNDSKTNEPMLKGKSSSTEIISSTIQDAVIDSVSGSNSSSAKNMKTSTSLSKQLENGQFVKKLLTPLPKLLLKAAQTSENALLKNFVDRVQSDPNTSEEEMETCLLLFLDLDKSSKLLTAFRLLNVHFFRGNRLNNTLTETQETEKNATMANAAVDVKVENSLSPHSNNQSSFSSNDLSSQNNEATPEPPSLSYKSTLILFKSLLTSISTCIHYIPALENELSPFKQEDDKEATLTSNKSAKHSFDDSPSASNNKNNSDTIYRDWVGGHHTKNEINDIATYAADRLLEHVIGKQPQIQSSGNRSPKKIDVRLDELRQSKEAIITFEVFGEWYNSGGFNLVPWLELLDLEKWDFAGKAAAESKKKEELKDKQAFNSDHNMHRASPPESYKNHSSSRTTKPDRSSSPSPNLFLDPYESPKLYNSDSRTIVSFDFPTSRDDGMSRKNEKHFQLKITEENLKMLRDLVNKSGLLSYAPERITDVLLRHSTHRRVSSPMTGRRGDVMVLDRHKFGKCIRELIPPDASRRFNPSDLENFSNYFTNFFSCFATIDGYGIDEVSTKRFAVGFSFLCSGNKSSKLSSAFDLLDYRKEGYLSQSRLIQYLQSFLTMLVGISLLSSSTHDISTTRKMLLEQNPQCVDLLKAVENGAKWTFSHFLKSFESKCKRKGDTSRRNMITFEDFATWYTDGGYGIAPWLELLDLKKFLSLLDNHGDRMVNNPRDHHREHGETSRNDRHYLGSKARSPKSTRTEEVLFTFPLAKGQSLVVLREDASYVRTVVNQLGLLSLSPDEVWNSLFSYIESCSSPSLSMRNSKNKRNSFGKCIDIDEGLFIRAIENLTHPSTGRKRSDASVSVSKRTLGNFFQSFDLEQKHSVAANQLMGGLTLLCGGKKSTKLSFAFSLFDERHYNCKKSSGEDDFRSLDKRELFYFLRSFLIVMFSCCKQSLDLSAEDVSRFICETANMVTDDVYQWLPKRSRQVNFDDFGKWYNEGGFEMAPWLELLDLNKWVLQGQAPIIHSNGHDPSTKSYPQRHDGIMKNDQRKVSQTFDKPQHKNELKHVEPIESSMLEDASHNICPSPPPDDAIDPHTDAFFNEDMDIDGLELSFMFPENDKENGGNLSANDCLSPSNLSQQSHSRAPENNISKLSKVEHQNGGALHGQPSSPRSQQSNSLKVHLITNDEQGGYMISISQRRVRLLKHLVMACDLFEIEPSSACEQIFSQLPDVSKGRRNRIQTISKKKFDDAMRKIISTSNGLKKSMSADTERLLLDLLSYIYTSFDSSGSNCVDAKEIACGFTVLCGGRKSDKLEHAFELMDRDNDGLLSRSDMVRYLFSFLTVLLSISSCPIGREPREQFLLTMDGNPIKVDENFLSQLIKDGCSWATTQVFSSAGRRQMKNGQECINFDDFADWYTKGGYTSIPWLELLDLRKWVLAEVQ